MVAFSRHSGEISDKQSLVSECVVGDNEMKPTTAMSAKKFQEAQRIAWVTNKYIKTNTSKPNLLLS